MTHTAAEEQTMSTTTHTAQLNSLENEILDAIPQSWSYRPGPRPSWMNDTRNPAEKAADWTPAHLNHASAVIVWKDELDGIAMGVVRGAVRYTTTDGDHEYFEASPFPGAWTRVRRSQILRVRAPQCL